MDTKQLKEVIERYISLSPNDDFCIEKCWKDMTDILSEDVLGTIQFFKNECTEDELYWTSSIFEDLIEKTQNKEIIEAIKERLDRVTEESYNQEKSSSEYMQKNVDYKEYVRSITIDIEYAEGKMLRD